MAIFFSAEKLGFYDDQLRAAYDAAGSWPVDAVEITPEQWNEFVSPPPAGKILGAVNKKPAWVDAPPPTLAQRATVALIAGLTVSLSGSITLAPTLFPTDLTAQRKINAVVTALAATKTFPGGATSFPIKDAEGAWHHLTVDQYTTVASVIATYVAALDLIADGNPLGATELPSSTVVLTA